MFSLRLVILKESVPTSELKLRRWLRHVPFVADETLVHSVVVFLQWLDHHSLRRGHEDMSAIFEELSSVVKPGDSSDGKSPVCACELCLFLQIHNLALRLDVRGESCCNVVQLQKTDNAVTLLLYSYRWLSNWLWRFPLLRSCWPNTDTSPGLPVLFLLCGAVLEQFQLLFHYILSGLVVLFPPWTTLETVKQVNVTYN